MGREGSTNLTRQFYKEIECCKRKEDNINIYPYKYIYGSEMQYQQKYRVTV